MLWVCSCTSDSKEAKSSSNGEGWEGETNGEQLWKSFLTSRRRLVFRGEDDKSEALVVLALKSDFVGLRVAVAGHLDVGGFGWAVDQRWSLWSLRLSSIIILSFCSSTYNIQCLNEQRFDFRHISNNYIVLFNNNNTGTVPCINLANNDVVLMLCRSFSQFDLRLI